MRRQFIELRDKMLYHLELIESKYILDRGLTIEDYKKKINQLIDELEQAESKNEKALSEKQDLKEKEIDEEIAKNEMEYINKVIVMEKYYNFLREHIEDYTYELRILYERLEYRVEVRDEKIRENSDKNALYDKMNARLFSKLMDQNKLYKESNAKWKIENIKDKDLFKKMTESFNDLKKRFKHFESYDDKQIQEIYKMKYKEAQELAIKVIYARTTINSQQLGLQNDEKENQEGVTLEFLQKDIDSNKTVEEEKKNENTEQNNGNDIHSILAKLPTERIKMAFKFILEEAEFLIETSVRK